MKRINKKTNIGIDSMEIGIETKVQINQCKTNDIISSITGNKVGRIKQSTGKKQGVRVFLNIPKMIRTDNIKPFGNSDKNRLSEISDDITKILREQLGVDLKKALISTVEINATAELENPQNVECIMNFFELIFTQENKKIYLTAHGKQNACYKNIPLTEDVLRNTHQIESLKTPRLGNKRFCWKIYNKGAEQNIQDRGILRLEQIHNRRSLEYENIPRRLDLFLTADNIIRLISLYRKSFQKYFVNIYWQHKGNSFVKKCVNTVLLELKKGTPPLLTAKIEREIISIDFEIFERAARSFYNNPKTATQAIRRVRNSGQVEIKKGAIRELVQVFRAILYCE